MPASEGDMVTWIPGMKDMTPEEVRARSTMGHCYASSCWFHFVIINDLLNEPQSDPGLSPNATKTCGRTYRLFNSKAFPTVKTLNAPCSRADCLTCRVGVVQYAQALNDKVVAGLRAVSTQALPC